MKRYATPFDVALRLALLITLLYVQRDIDNLLPGTGLLVGIAQVWLVITLATRTANPEPGQCDCPCRQESATAPYLTTPEASATEGGERS